MRKKNEHGGGSRTNVNGLKFEQVTSLNEAFTNKGYKVINGRVLDKNDKLLGFSVPKRAIYKFLVNRGIDYREYNSKGWQPDECFINERNHVAYIIEKKFQNSSGSVDEKLPGCEFKKWEYEKLFHPIGYKVEYIYVFNDWFKQPVYKDVLEYIEIKNCSYYYEQIPFDSLGIS